MGPWRIPLWPTGEKGGTDAALCLSAAYGSIKRPGRQGRKSPPRRKEKEERKIPHEVGVEAGPSGAQSQGGAVVRGPQEEEETAKAKIRDIIRQSLGLQ